MISKRFPCSHTILSHDSHTILTRFSHDSHTILTRFSHDSHTKTKKSLKKHNFHDFQTISLFSHDSHTILTRFSHDCVRIVWEQRFPRDFHAISLFSHDSHTILTRFSHDSLTQFSHDSHTNNYFGRPQWLPGLGVITWLQVQEIRKYKISIRVHPNIL